MNITVVRFRDGTYGIRHDSGGYYMYYDFEFTNKWHSLDIKFLYSCKTTLEKAIEAYNILLNLDIGSPI